MVTWEIIGLESFQKNKEDSLFFLFTFRFFHSVLSLHYFHNLFLYSVISRGIFITGSTIVGAAIKAPRIRSKNLIRYVEYSIKLRSFIPSNLGIRFLFK